MSKVFFRKKSFGTNLMENVIIAMVKNSTFHALILPISSIFFCSGKQTIWMSNSTDELTLSVGHEPSNFDDPCESRITSWTNYNHGILNFINDVDSKTKAEDDNFFLKLQLVKNLNLQIYFFEEIFTILDY